MPFSISDVVIPEDKCVSPHTKTYSKHALYGGASISFVNYAVQEKAIDILFLQTLPEYEGKGLATLLLNQLWQKAVDQQKDLTIRAVQDGMSFYNNWYVNKVCPNEEYRRSASKRFYTFETTATFSELRLPYKELKKFSIPKEALEKYWEELEKNSLQSPESGRFNSF